MPGDFLFVKIELIFLGNARLQPALPADLSLAKAHLPCSGRSISPVVWRLSKYHVRNCCT